MLNLHDLWNHLKVPGVANKLEKAGDILQYALPWFALLFVVLSVDAFYAQSAAIAWAVLNVMNVITNVFWKWAFNFTKLGVRPDGGKHSFPSGHTMGAFAGPLFLHATIGLSWVVVTMYALAVLTAVSRVVAHKHWPRDVVAGAILTAIVMFVGPLLVMLVMAITG